MLIEQGNVIPPHLHRRARLAEGSGAVVRGLFDRQVGRRRTATAATICSRSRPAASRARAPMSRAAFRCTRTTRPSSRSASILDKADKGILYDEITTIDNALTRPWTVLKTLIRVAQSDVVREQLPGGQQPRADRQGQLRDERRRQADADAQEPGAAGSELFRDSEEVAHMRKRVFNWQGQGFVYLGLEGKAGEPLGAAVERRCSRAPAKSCARPACRSTDMSCARACSAAPARRATQ